jgi:hypothetical protein
MIQTKFGFNWSSSFRGEDFLKSLRRTMTTSDGKSSHGLWPGELKKLIILTSFANIEYYLFDIFLLIKFFGINITDLYT